MLIVLFIIASIAAQLVTPFGAGVLMLPIAIGMAEHLPSTHYLHLHADDERGHKLHDSSRLHHQSHGAGQKLSIHGLHATGASSRHTCGNRHHPIDTDLLPSDLIR